MIAAVCLFIKCLAIGSMRILLKWSETIANDLRDIILVTILPMTVIILTNILLVRILKNRAQNNRSSEDKFDLAALLLCTSVVFVLLRIPLLVAASLGLAHHSGLVEQPPDWLADLIVICDLTVYSSNVICFSLSNKNFRVAIMNLKRKRTEIHINLDTPEPVSKRLPSSENCETVKQSDEADIKWNRQSCKSIADGQCEVEVTSNSGAILHI